MADHALHELHPREQVGARTGAAYDYQYHQAAAEALSLLDDSGVVCLYCEWHDDYVTEASSSATYRFHQVKTRAKSKGPWKASEFFGIPRGKGGGQHAPAKTDSVFAHLWDHVQKFGQRCTAFVFVTDAGVEPSLEQLVIEAHTVDKVSQLTPQSLKIFTRARDACALSLPGITDDTLLRFLSQLHVHEALGALRDLPGCRILIAKQILDASEVDLKISEAEKIGADLVAAVRDRSHRTLRAIPASAHVLREAKGIVIDNILQILSLSAEGYKELRSQGRETVRTLSRLHRLCKRNNVPDALIPDFCRYKTTWDAWWLEQRHLVDELDYLALKAACADILKAHGAGLSFAQVVDQARALAGSYRDTLNSSEALTGELVVGFIIALAVEAEA